MRFVALASIVLAVAGSAAAHVSTYRVGARPMSILYAAGSIWTADYAGGTVSRVNPKTKRRIAIRVGSHPWGLAYAGGSVWVGSIDADTVTRIDPRRNRITRRITVGRGPDGLAASPDGSTLWIADYRDGRVSKIDVASGTVTVVAELAPENFEHVDVSTGRVWISSESGALRRLDPDTGKVELTVNACDDTDYVVGGAGSVWATCYLGTDVVRIDPQTGARTATIPIGTGGQGIAVDASSAWVANNDTARLLRIDLATNEVTGSFKTGFGPRDVLAALGSIWVTNANASTVSRFTFR